MKHNCIYIKPAGGEFELNVFGEFELNVLFSGCAHPAHTLQARFLLIQMSQ